jgi:hypothetical protein
MNDALANRIVALSVSKSPDLARLGYPDSEIDRLLGKLCTELVVQGSRVLYGGDLRLDGYTLHLFRHVAQAYRAGKTPAPFINFLPAYVLAETNPEELRRHLLANALSSETWLTLDGQEIVDVRADENRFILTTLATRKMKLLDETQFAAWLATPKASDRAAQLTQMRESSSCKAFTRVIVGGKTGDTTVKDDDYAGKMPGIVEEALCTLEAGRIPIVLGAFGGAALDLAIAMELLPESARLKRGLQNPTYALALVRAAEVWRASPMLVHRNQLADFAGRDDTDTLARDIARFVCGLAS